MLYVCRKHLDTLISFLGLALLSLALSSCTVQLIGGALSSSSNGGGNGNGGGGSSTVNLEVPIAMIDTGIGSSSTGSTPNKVSRTGLDTSDYDGAVTYSFEIVGTRVFRIPNRICRSYDSQYLC